MGGVEGVVEEAVLEEGGVEAGRRVHLRREVGKGVGCMRRAADIFGPGQRPGQRPRPAGVRHVHVTCVRAAVGLGTGLGEEEEGKGGGGNANGGGWVGG